MPGRETRHPSIAQRLRRGGSAFIKVLATVSTEPSYEAYSWGRRWSWSAWSLYQMLFLLRLFSPLQWVKYIYRWWKKRPVRVQPGAALHSSMEEKPRPDFHAAYTEYYLLVILALAAIAYWAQGFALDTLWVQRIAYAVLLLLLAESIQWTFYYTLFRPLMERGNLNIHDEAEYLVVLPVVMLTQLFLLATLWNKTLGESALLILNVADPLGAQPIHGTGLLHHLWFGVRKQALFADLLGQSYLVIVIASLIRVIPLLHVRKRLNITVIGYGSVVRERLLPALLLVYAPKQIAIAADFLSETDLAELRELHLHSHFAPSGAASMTRGDIITSICEWAEKHSKFAIVAVPTHSHLDYMLQLSRRCVKFAIEKPIVGTEAELDLLTNRSSANVFDNTFVLSYYWLEKALSLNYLLSLNPNYRSHLCLKDEHGREPSAQEIAFHRTRLGTLQQVFIEFLEVSETPERGWTELLENGGMVMETLVHPLTLAINTCRLSATSETPGQPFWAAPPTTRWMRHRHSAATKSPATRQSKSIGPTYVEIAGTTSDGVLIEIRCGKYLVEQKSRLMIARYQHGWLTTDLDSMTTRLFLGTAAGPERLLEISHKVFLASQDKRDRTLANPGEQGAPRPYQDQTDMMNSFFLDGWGGLRFDDHPSQLNVLRELIQLSQTIPPPASIPDDKEALHAATLSNACMLDPSLAPSR